MNEVLEMLRKAMEVGSKTAEAAWVMAVQQVIVKGYAFLFFSIPLMLASIPMLGLCYHFWKKYKTREDDDYVPVVVLFGAIGAILITASLVMVTFEAIPRLACPDGWLLLHLLGK